MTVDRFWLEVRILRGPRPDDMEIVNDRAAQMEHNVATTSLRHVMAGNNDVVRARIDGQIKEEATNVLAGMGLSVSDAIRVLLIRIATDKALPFDINRVHAQHKIKKP